MEQQKKNMSGEQKNSELADMYYIPGQGTITLKDIQRYQKDKEQDERIKIQANFFMEIEKQIKNISDKDRTYLIQQTLKHENREVRKIGASLIWIAPETDQASLILQSLDNEDIEVRKIVIDIIENISSTQRTSIIKKILSDRNPEIVKEGAYIINNAPHKEILKLRQIVLTLTEKYLKSEDIKIRKYGASMIHSVPEKKIYSLIEQTLTDPNPQVRKEGASMIWSAPKEKIHLLIEQTLTDPNPQVRKEGASMVKYVPENERTRLQQNIYKLILKQLENENLEIQKSGLSIISGVPDDKKEELLQIISEKKLTKFLIESPLYDKNENIYENSFSRDNFEKTGSKTTLLGGKLKDKIIMRQLRPGTFLVWQSLYENHKLWKDAGFNYIPIEPIQAYHLNENTKLVDVYSGVLDLNFDSWINIAGNKFKEFLNEKQEEIIKIIEGLNIEHGHPHDDNFCLRFFRNEDGEPDLTKEPRIYLIDFDQAHFLEN